MNKVTLAKSVTQLILSDLKSRRGFNHWWNVIDEDIKDEIYDSIIELIYKSYGVNEDEER